MRRDFFLRRPSPRSRLLWCYLLALACILSHGFILSELPRPSSRTVPDAAVIRRCGAGGRTPTSTSRRTCGRLSGCSSNSPRRDLSPPVSFLLFPPSFSPLSPPPPPLAFLPLLPLLSDQAKIHSPRLVETPKALLSITSTASICWQWRSANPSDTHVTKVFRVEQHETVASSRNLEYWSDTRRRHRAWWVKKKCGTVCRRDASRSTIAGSAEDDERLGKGGFMRVVKLAQQAYVQPVRTPREDAKKVIPVWRQNAVPSSFRTDPRPLWLARACVLGARDRSDLLWPRLTRATGLAVAAICSVTPLFLIRAEGAPRARAREAFHVRGR